MFFAIIVLLILVVAFLVYKLNSGKHKAKKGGHAASHFNNLTTGGVNPLWWNGSGDAGYGGSVTRDETRFQAAAFGGGPSVFNGGLREGLAGSKAGLAYGGGMAPAMPMPGAGGNTNAPGGNIHGATYNAGGIPMSGIVACAPGMVPVRTPGPQGGIITTCMPKGGALPSVASACHSKWDSAATSEAQALATLGSFGHDAYGLSKLQHVINGADSPASTAATSLSDAALSSQLYHGGI